MAEKKVLTGVRSEDLASTDPAVRRTALENLAQNERIVFGRVSQQTKSELATLDILYDQDLTARLIAMSKLSDDELINSGLLTTDQVFDAAVPCYDKIIVACGLVQRGEDLVARGQAKKLLAPLEKFKLIVLDFHGIRSIGQGFADEAFRVFLLQHPTVSLAYINANERVSWMIRRAKNRSIEIQGNQELYRQWV